MSTIAATSTVHPSIELALARGLAIVNGAVAGL